MAAVLAGGVGAPGAALGADCTGGPEVTAEVCSEEHRLISRFQHKIPVDQDVGKTITSGQITLPHLVLFIWFVYI